MGRIKVQRLIVVFNILLSLSSPVLSQFTAPESAPYEITAKAMNRNKALVQWRAPLQPNGEIEVSWAVFCMIMFLGLPPDKKSVIRDRL